MTAHSVTGHGPGSSGKPTLNQLASLANGPQILAAGVVSTTGGEEETSPPSSNATVTLPFVLAGGAENYVVLLTPVNGQQVYISEMNENGDGNFTGFDIIADGNFDVMYMVTRAGFKPNV